MKIFRTITPALFAIGLTASLSACMKTPEMDKDFGPEVTADEMTSTLGSTQGEATKDSINNIKKGEFVYFEKSNQIENLYPVVFKQTGKTVTDKVEDNNKIIFTITQQLRELDAGTGDMKPSQSQSSACLEKTSGGCGVATDSIGVMDVMQAAPVTATMAAAVTSDPKPDFGTFSGKFNDLSWKSLAQRAQQTVIKYTYHNLKKIYTTMPTPSLVSMRPDCGGRKNPCATPMQIIQVSFDEVDWSTEKYPVKYSYVLGFSAEAPFFAAQLMSCGSTTVPYESQRIALLQCETVKDFTVGKDPTP